MSQANSRAQSRTEIATEPVKPFSTVNSTTNLKTSINLKDADTNPSTPATKGTDNYDDILNMISDARKKIFQINESTAKSATLNAQTNTSTISATKATSETVKPLAGSYLSTNVGTYSTPTRYESPVKDLDYNSRERNLSPAARAILEGVFPVNTQPTTFTSSVNMTSSQFTTPVRGRETTLKSSQVNLNGTNYTVVKTLTEQEYQEGIKRGSLSPVSKRITSTSSPVVNTTTTSTTIPAPTLDQYGMSEELKKILSTPMKVPQSTIEYSSDPTNRSPTKVNMTSSVLSTSSVLNSAGSNFVPVTAWKEIPQGLSPEAARILRSAPTLDSKSTISSEVKKSYARINNLINAPKTTDYKATQNRLLKKESDDQSFAIKAFILAMIILFVAMLVSQIVGLDDILYGSR